MRKFILAALVLVVIGVGVSFLLIPDQGEIAGLQARDIETIGVNNIDVEAEYAQGRRTYPIIKTLAEKRIGEGNRDEAIRLYEEYVAANPNSIPGRQRLAEQYLIAGRNADFNAQVDAIAALTPSPESLRALSDLHNANKNYPKQAEALQQLVELTDKRDPVAMVDLATVKAAMGDKEGALQVIADIKEEHPDFQSYGIVRIEVGVLADDGKIEEAFAKAKAWTDRPVEETNQSDIPPTANPPSATVVSPATDTSIRALEVADLATVLHYSGYPDKAVELIEPHIALIGESSELAVAYVNAQIALGKDEEAYRLLTELDKNGKLTPPLYHPYLQLAMKRNDVAAAETIAQQMDVTIFTEIQALDLIDLARTENVGQVLPVLLDRFGQPTVLEKKPVLTAVISILKDEKEQDEKIATALAGELSTPQRLRLAENCVWAGKTKCFEDIVKPFPPVKDMTPDQVSEYAQLYVIANRPEDVIDDVGERAKSGEAHPDIVFAHMRLAAAAGREEITKPWLKVNGATLPMEKMKELFHVANDHNRAPIAVDIAERLHARDPSPMNREILATAWVGAGQYGKALPILRERLAYGGTDDEYVFALGKLAPKDPAVRKELTDYAEARLRANQGSNDAQIGYAYILLENGRGQVARAYINEYAKTRGEAWRVMKAEIEQANTAADDTQLTVAQRMAIARNPKTPDRVKRDIAYGLADQGHKAEATAIFTQLAKGKGPRSQEMEDLLFMWGGTLDEEQIAYLQLRAANAPAHERDQWGELIGNYGDDTAVMNYVSTTPDALYNRPLRQKYFGMVAQTGSRQNFDANMRDWVAKTTDIPALADYAQIAQDTGYYDASRNAWQRVEALQPSNERALSALSSLAYMQSNYTASKNYADRYIAQQATNPKPETDPSEVHSTRADLYKREGKAEEAKREYMEVVRILGAGATEPDDLSRLYSAQFEIGQHDAAKQGFEALLAANPDNKNLLADYMGKLIEFRYYDDATRIANQYDKSSPYYNRDSALQGQSSSVESIERLNGGRAMRITFRQPVEEHAPVNLAKVNELGWVEQASLGYNTLSVSAKPGYIVRYVPTAAEQFEVIPAATAVLSPQAEAQMQQDLRLQLLYARIERETGQLDKASERLNILQQYYPNDPNLMASRADVEAAKGDAAEAMEILEQAQALTPENENIALLLSDIRRYQETNFIKADIESRNYGDNGEFITTLMGAWRINSRYETGFKLQNNAISPENMIRPGTGTLTSESTNHQQAEVWLAHYLNEGARLQGSLFMDHSEDTDLIADADADDSTFGAGLYYRVDNRWNGETEVFAEYHRPYWEYPQAAFARANRDRIGAMHNMALDEDNIIGGEISLNNYNIALEDNQLMTALIELYFIHDLQDMTATQPYFGVGYNLDAEYKIGRHDTSTTGITHHPFDWRVQEVHTISGIYRDDWTPATHAEFVGGWSFDRLNGNGPGMGGEVRQDLTDQWELGVRARYGMESQQEGDDNAYNLGAHLMYKF